MSRYVVAVTREARRRGVSVRVLREIPDVIVENDTDARAVIEVSDKLAREIKARFRGELLIEPVIAHKTS